jgi:hypothetical protein
MDLSFELPTHKNSLKLNPCKLMHEIPFLLCQSLLVSRKQPLGAYKDSAS